MKPETMEKLAHELLEAKDNLDLQTVSIDMLSGYNKPDNRELLTIYLYRITEVLTNFKSKLASKKNHLRRFVTK